MTDKAKALGAALEATPIDQAVDVFFAWLGTQVPKFITNPVALAIAQAGLRAANEIVDGILAHYNV